MVSALTLTRDQFLTNLSRPKHPYVITRQAPIILDAYLPRKILITIVAVRIEEFFFHIVRIYIPLCIPHGICKMDDHFKVTFRHRSTTE